MYRMVTLGLTTAHERCLVWNTDLNPALTAQTLFLSQAPCLLLHVFWPFIMFPVNTSWPRSHVCCGGWLFVLLSRLPVFCRLRVCLRHSDKLRLILDKVMLLVRVVHVWVRWTREGNFLCFHWPAGQMVDCCSLSVVEVPGEPFLGKS